MNVHLTRWGAFLASALILSAPLGAQESPESPLKNPAFADTDADGTPEGWNPYPPGDGSLRVLSPAPGGGLVFKDDDKNNGLGIEQWMQVQEGISYTATADVTGNGAVSLMLIFAKVKPAKAGDLKSVQLSDKSVRAAAGSIAEVTAIAPAGAKCLKLWLYCPKIGVTDVVIHKVTLTSSTPTSPATVPAANTSTAPVPTAAAQPAPVAAPAKTTPTGPVPEGNLLKNPSFADADGEGTPEDWKPYPPGNGGTLVLAPSPGGGLVFKDNDKDNGLGIDQWVPVEEGLRYTASAKVSGSGGVTLSLIFAPKIPNKPGDLKSIQLSDKSSRAAAGQITETIGIAPAGAKWVKVWLYCPKIGTTDVVIDQVTLTTSSPSASGPASGSGTSAASAPAPASPLPSGLTSVLDFETGDFSQGHGVEGGENLIVKAGEGPVREGKFAYKSALKLDKHRAEFSGHRSDGSGIARYGWSMYIPKEFDANTHFSIITQWHSWDTKPESPKDGGPPTCLTISKGNLQLKLLHQSDDGWTSKPTYFSLGPIDDMRGQWTDWVMEVNWQGPGKGGWLKLYKNDKLVLDHQGTTWYEGKDKGPYFKFGNYKGALQWKGTEEGAVIYFDSGRMALGEQSTYKMVAPSAYSPRPEK